MKKFSRLLVEKLSVFLGNTAHQALIEEDNDYQDFLELIQLALYKKAAVHVIYSNQKSITGDIVKWDEERQQLIVKNFAKSMTAIIRLSSIQKLSLVPEAIRTSQKRLGESP